MSTGGVSGKIARQFTCTVRVETGSTGPTEGGTVDIYWAASLSGTAGTANPGGTTGADAAYTGTAASTLAQSLLQLEFLGSHTATGDAQNTPQQSSFLVTLPTRYGMPVVVNNFDDVLNNTDDIEMSITLTPLEDEIQ